MIRSALTTREIRWGRAAILLCGALILYFSGRWISDELVHQFGLLMRPHNEPLLHRTIMTAMVVYIVLMAIPFMPAVEIGFSMLVIFGGKIALLVYASTILALTLAYALGRLIPARLAVRIFGLLGLARAQGLVRHLAPLSGQERLAFIERESRVRLVPHVVRHRFVMLAVLLNLPGNVVVGGGGGIALLAGMTRLFPFPTYLITVALAVAPVPLLIFLMD